MLDIKGISATLKRPGLSVRSTDHIYLTEECTVVNAGIGSLNRKFHEFRMPVGGAMNMSRAYFGNFSCLFPIVT